MSASPRGDSQEHDPAGTPVRAVFFGSGAFAVPILEALATDPNVALAGVVTAPPRPAGRGGRLHPTPVDRRATELGVRLLRAERVRSPETVEAIRSVAPDLGILADFGQLIPPALLELPRLGMLNLHPSLLPRHRGATPIPATILAADEVAGVTLFRMDAGLDTGPIVAAERWPLNGTERAPELEARAAGAAADLLRVALPDWIGGRLVPRPQPEERMTLTRPLGRSHGRLDGAAAAASDLERRVRAFDPWPGTFVEAPSGRLAVLSASIEHAEPGDVPGTLVPDGDGVALATIDGRLRLDEVRPAGGRSMTGAEWRRGRRDALAVAR